MNTISHRGHPGSILPEVRREVIERAGNRCERCGEPGRDVGADGFYNGLHIHHKNGKREVRHNHPGNLELLCVSCHTVAGKRACPICGRDLPPGPLMLHLNGYLNAERRERIRAWVGKELRIPIGPPLSPTGFLNGVLHLVPAKGNLIVKCGGKSQPVKLWTLLFHNREILGDSVDPIDSLKHLAPLIEELKGK